MKLRSIALSVLIALAGAQAAWGASIGLFSDQNCSSCNLQIPLGETRMMYVCVLPGDISWAAAEFRVVGLPDGWTAVSVRNPASAAALGDPFGSRADIAFPTAQTGDCGLLYTVAVTATTEAQDITLQVVGGNPPSVPDRPYPWLLDACEACTAFHQVDGGTLYINSPVNCTVTMTPNTWSGVKALYE